MSKAFLAKLSESKAVKVEGWEGKYILMPEETPAQNVTLEIGFFEPGEILKTHTHMDSEELYYILKGNGYMRADEDEFDIEEGMMVYIPPKAAHYLKNTGKETLKVVFITSPPEKWWLLERLEKLENRMKKIEERLSKTP